LSELRDALGGLNRASLETDLEAMIVRTWKPWSSKFGKALGGHDLSRFEEYLDVVDLEAVDQKGDATAAETIHWLTRDRGNDEC